jgi:hypothetical protein
MVGQFVLEVAVGFNDLGGSGVGSVDGGISGMHRGYKGLASASEVEHRHHDKG